MRAALERLNAKWRNQGWPTLRFGLGLNHGEATIGNIGSERKMDFTAIGEVINAASRIEQLTTQVGHDILISETLARFASDTFEIKGGGSVKIKGIAQPVQIFQLAGLRGSPTVPTWRAEPVHLPVARSMCSEPVNSK
jgi:adenylate cyclase